MICSIENSRYRLSARSTGAELAGFADISGPAEYEYIWQRCEIWNGQSPLLFTVVGRLRDDIYRLNGVEYRMEKHGFARKLPFELESKSADSMTFLLKENAETLAKYPYPFELRVAFRLTGSGFVMEHRVKNTGDSTMYFSLGAHPAFRCKIGDRVVMDENETAGAYRLDENFLRAEKQLPVFDNSREIVVTEDLFINDALIFDGLKSRGATVQKADGRSVHVDFGGAPCLGIWARPAAEYVCIEPWYGIDDSWNADHDFTRKHRILSLKAGNEFLVPVTVTAL